LSSVKTEKKKNLHFTGCSIEAL